MRYAMSAGVCNQKSKYHNKPEKALTKTTFGKICVRQNIVMPKDHSVEHDPVMCRVKPTSDRRIVCKGSW